MKNLTFVICHHHSAVVTEFVKCTWKILHTISQCEGHTTNFAHNVLIIINTIPIGGFQFSGALIMVALWKRADYYIFILWFLLSFFFPRLISAVGDWMSAILPHHRLSANLGCRSETCCTRLAKNAGHKNCQKVAICTPSYNFVGLYLRN